MDARVQLVHPGDDRREHERDVRNLGQRVNVNINRNDDHVGIDASPRREVSPHGRAGSCYAPGVFYVTLGLMLLSLLVVATANEPRPRRRR